MVADAIESVLTLHERADCLKAYAQIADLSPEQRQGIINILRMVRKEPEAELGDPQFAVPWEEAHKKDTWNRGVLQGLDDAEEFLFKPETVQALIERLQKPQEQ